MINAISAEILKCLKYKRNHKILSIMALVPPMALSIFFIQAFTFTGHGGFPLVVVNYDSDNVNSWTDKFIDCLDSKEGTIPYFEVTIAEEQEALDMLDLRKTFVIIYIPSDFSLNLTNNLEITLESKINNIHEDLSKNLRLGLEGRIYQFSLKYQLEEGDNPGIIIKKSAVYDTILTRPDYMISGIIIFSIMFFALLDGAILGTSEKEGKTDIEIKMALDGNLKAKIGKILATIIISGINSFVLLIYIYLIYRPYFTGFLSVLHFVLSFICLASLFATLGVNYGMKVGDLRAVPGPSILITVSLWMVGGAINPLEFSAGSSFFKLLPSSAGTRILTAAVFERGIEHLSESWLILFGWFLLALIVNLIQYVKSKR